MAKGTLWAALYNAVNLHKLPLSVTLYWKKFHRRIRPAMSREPVVFGSVCVLRVISLSTAVRPCPRPYAHVSYLRESPPTPRRKLPCAARGTDSFKRSQNAINLPLTRKLPFAQVLGFALLAARHVGLVVAFRLSSHWEIRPYKVDSK